MGKTIAKWCVLILLLAYAIGMSVWANHQAAKHICTGIDVNIRGISHVDSITRQGVMEELKKYKHRIVGAPFNTVNTLDIENYLKGFSNFEDVECLMTSQGRLMVDVVPMIPEVRIFDGNKSYYVNKDGKKIATNAEFFTDVPVISGHFGKHLRPVDILPVTRFVIRDSLLRQLVGMVSVIDKDNILLIPRFDGQVINFGDTSRLEEKRLALLTAYRNILPYKGWNTYDTISVKFKGMIVASRRDKGPLHPVIIPDESSDPEEGALPTGQPDINHTQRDN
ncbi:MAG: hypothetical protein K2N03_01280 [Muribaculaceae bacterium]|nr:hypothetical protein [Muribaculaceae bacterium]